MKVNAKVRYKLQRLIKNLHEASGNTWTSQPREAYADVYYSVDEALNLVTKCAPCDPKSATDIRVFLDRASELQAQSPEGEDQELYRLADLSSQFVDVVTKYNTVLNELMMGLNDYKAAIEPMMGLDNYNAALNTMMGEARRRSKKN